MTSYLALYSVVRFFVEILRDPGRVSPDAGALTTGQWLSLGLLALALFVWYRARESAAARKSEMMPVFTRRARGACLPLIALLLLALPVRAEKVTYSYDTAGRLTRVDYGNSKSITYSYDKNGSLLSRLVSGAGPVFAAGGVVNAASFLPGPVSPGEMITMFGSGIGPATLTGLKLTESGFIDTSLAGTRVLFDGTPAPLIYVSSAQLSAIVPYAVAGKNATQVQIEYQGVRSSSVQLAVAAAAPGLFASDSSGRGQAAAFNQDGSLNSAAQPAARGTVVILFGTGEGPTDPAGADGKPAGDPLPKPSAPVRVMIGSAAAQVLYGGAAPGFAGLLQLNVLVPEDAPSGDAVPVVVTVGDAPSQAGVTLAIRADR